LQDVSLTKSGQGIWQPGDNIDFNESLFVLFLDFQTVVFEFLNSIIYRSCY